MNNRIDLTPYLPKTAKRISRWQRSLETAIAVAEIITTLAIGACMITGFFLCVQIF